MIWIIKICYLDFCCVKYNTGFSTQVQAKLHLFLEGLGENPLPCLIQILRPPTCWVPSPPIFIFRQPLSRFFSCGITLTLPSSHQFLLLWLSLCLSYTFKNFCDYIVPPWIIQSNLSVFWLASLIPYVIFLCYLI